LVVRVALLSVVFITFQVCHFYHKQELHIMTQASFNLTQTIIRFPEITLKTRDAHKLRGFFGELFKEHSPLLHNHYDDGKVRYGYPLVQYKVIDRVPLLTGFGEGSRLLIELFLKIKYLDIEGVRYEINSKNISNVVNELGDFSQLYEYQFKTLWMALNQKNFGEYENLRTEEEKAEFLNKQLQNNILSFYKGVSYRINERIMVKGHFMEKTTKFKNRDMLAFKGDFVSNAPLPTWVGLGKAVSRGFGTVGIKN
jgi:hypothetical protein